MWRSGWTLKWTLITVAVASVAAMSGLAVVLAVDDDDPKPTSTPVSEPAESPTAEVTPALPTPPPAPTPLAEPREVPAVPAGTDAAAMRVGAVIDADPVRVYTGDGDCL